MSRLQATGQQYQIYDPLEFSSVVAGHGLDVASDEECIQGRALAAELISPHVASAAVLLNVQVKTGATVFVHRSGGGIDGVLAMVALTPDGLRAVLEGRFDTRNPDDSFVCAPGDAYAGVYGWGLAGRTRRASAAVMLGAMALRDHYPALPFFSRTATAAGAKVVRGRMGYAPYPGAPDDLLWNPVRTYVEEQAA